MGKMTYPIQWFVIFTLLWPFGNGFTNKQNQHHQQTSSTTRRQAIKMEPGQILIPSYENPGRFDAACAANPVVLPPSKDGDKWQLYYYGNAGTWSNGKPGFLPTGWCGLAESEDGLEWTKIDGASENASIFGPSEKPEDWDSLHVGVGDVLHMGDGELHMYYFGGSNESVNLGPAGDIAGIRMKIGKAVSTDNGRTWERQGVCLGIDENEGLFCSWPRILILSDDDWKMFYHSFNGNVWRVFGAQSVDKGRTWTRTGLVLKGDDQNFDSAGIGTRAVTSYRDGWLMVYEGVDAEGTHRLGASVSSNAEDWEKLENILGCQQAGGPIAEPGVGAMGTWTSTVVGTPYLVTLPDGSLRLYHVARTGEEGHSIGCIVSESGDVAPSSWKPLTSASRK